MMGSYNSYENLESVGDNSYFSMILFKNNVFYKIRTIKVYKL